VDTPLTHRNRMMTIAHVINDFKNISRLYDRVIGTHSMGGPAEE